MNTITVYSHFLFDKIPGTQLIRTHNNKAYCIWTLALPTLDCGWRISFSPFSASLCTYSQPVYLLSHREELGVNPFSHSGHCIGLPSKISILV